MTKFCFLVLIFAFPGYPQQKAADPSPKPTCVILKRMGPADEVTSHLYSFGIRGKQYQYVEGDLPLGVKFHGRLTDNDVRKILSKGGKVGVVKQDYTHQDVIDARESCHEQEAEEAK